MVEQREYGATGRSLSVLGFGGVLLVGLDQPESNRLVSEAIGRGVTYFDVAPSYGRDQETEKRLGPALKPNRDRVFLACKSGDRTAAGARAELERSLRHLETDHFDLYQLHAVSSLEEVARVFGPGGAMETLVAAKQEGLIRHIGFSAHSAEAAVAAMDLYSFESVLFPVNFVTWYSGNFGRQILEKAQERSVARLALKAMARTQWRNASHPSLPNCWYEPLTDRETASLALRWTLSKPITAAIPPGDPTLFRMALDIVENYSPITEAEEQQLRRLALDLEPIFQAA
jgi:aryl-alcohol dehydrogenase-like predicted oxidoreductase